MTELCDEDEDEDTYIAMYKGCMESVVHTYNVGTKGFINVAIVLL